MSMFHELMMRKKEETMYATIKGTLTENDGVFSGFSSSNYLKLQQQFQPADKNWEIVIKTEITQLNVVQTIIGSSTNSKNIQLAIRDTNIIRFYRTTTGIDDIVVNSSLTIDSLGVYYFKISFNGSQYKVSVSQDGNNYIDYITSTNSTPIYNNSSVLALGYNERSASEYFRGSIDLNNSYIKLGSTKYNLQAVVGYTVVGSPTITDGVVSGFSSSDYLQVKNALPTTIGNKYVFEGEVSLSSLPSETQYILSFNCNSNTGDSTFGFAFRSSGKFAIATSDGSRTTVTNGNLSYQANTIYKYRIETDLNTYVRLYINEELDLSLALSYTIVKPYNGNINYGVFITTTLSLSNGSMNINNTSIKANNKLVFNGQQA